MEKKVRLYIENLFKSFKQDEYTLDTKEELISNLLERINDSLETGMNNEEAFDNAIGNLGSKNEIKKIFNFKSLDYMTFEYNLNKTYSAIATIIYIILGFAFDLWHPGWVIFVVAIAFSEFKLLDKKSYFIPIISLVYVFIGIMWDYWHPGWIIFPITFVLLASMKKKFGALILMAGAIYFVLGALFGNWLEFSIIFVVAGGLIAGRDELVGGLWIFTIAIYLLLGILFDLWHPGWLVFLVSISLTALFVERSIVSFSWVISITVFLYLGFIFSLWHPAWIVFVVAAAVSAYFDEGISIEAKKILDNPNNMENLENEE